MSDDLDFRALKSLAESRLPLSRLFTLLGYSGGEASTRWGKCPECGKDGKFRNTGDKSFKCFTPECRLNPDNLVLSGLRANATGLIAVTKGLGDKPAFFEYLRMAKVIDEDTYKSLMGEGSPKKKQPKKKPAPVEAGPKEPEPATETPDPKEEEADPETEAPQKSKIVSLTGDPIPDEEAAERPVRSLEDGNPWQDLWKAMRLGDGDRTKLITERGLSRATVELAGFRSSRESNAELIEALRARYSDDDLVEYGILRNDDARGYRPEPQLCGWGITKEIDPETGKRKFALVHPILIPYFDPMGQVVSIRAHKGGIPKRILPGQIEYTNYSRPYGEHFLRKHRGTKWCVLTEGEFKAAAVQQCGIPGMAVPGISFISNEGFRAELLHILKRHHIEEVVVIFDNEDKSHKPEDKRYDVVIWANVVAHKLKEAGIRRVRIGQLPDEHRIDGKADFDGILQQQVARLGEKEGTAAAKTIFEATIRAAAKPVDFIDELFPNRAKQIIHSRVVRYTRSRQIAIGGDEEREKAFLFQNDNPKLAAALRDTIGCYYVRKNPDPKKIKDWTDERSRLYQKLKEFREAGDQPGPARHVRIAILMIDELLLGWPERISNFSLECLYRVVAEEDNKIQYYVKAYMPLERKKLHVLIPAKKRARLAEFREFCQETLGGTFKGGERDLQAITEDLDVDSVWRTVHEVNAYGHHEASGMFIWGDVAWDKEGRRILPDKDMIFWSGDNGYQVDISPDRIGEGMQQGAPLMHPDLPDRPDLNAVTMQWLLDLRDAVGGLEAWALVGTVVAYLAMPAFFRKHGQQHPGLWLHGTYGDGKTYIARWLMRLAGFGHVDGITMTPATTDVALFRSLAQYSCLPVFFDEYRAEYATDQRNGLLRNAFDRTAAAKGRIDNMRRTRSVSPSTTPLVCGESECTDAATRSRYVQAVISKQRRAPDPGKVRFRRLEDISESLYQVGRQMMDRRQNFEHEFLSAFAAWNLELDKPENAKVKAKANDRAVLSYGVAFSGLAALAAILDLKALDGPINQAFLPFLLRYMAVADSDTKSSGVVETFWENFISALHQKAISHDCIRRAWVRPHETEEGKVLFCSEYEARDGTGREVALINASDSFSAFEEFLRKRGRSFPLDHANLAKYLRNQKYWVWKYTESGWKAKWGGAKRSTWGVYLDEFPWTDEIANLLAESATDLIESDD